MLVMFKRDHKMLARLHARCAILRSRLEGKLLKDDSGIRAELHSLEWAIAKLTGETP